MLRFTGSTGSRRVLFTVVLALFAAGCKPPKETASAREEKESATAQESNPADKKQDGQAIRYRFIVSMISIGEGTDLKAGSDLMNYLAEYKKQQGVEIAYTPVPWGREGEVDFCFLLEELDKEAQKNFIAAVRERLGNSKLVQFAENETCSHLR